VVVRALLIANASDADPGFVGERLRWHGYAFTECHREHPDEWPSLDGVDLVVMLGSDWSVYWPGVAASVDAECELVREAHRRDVPQFGICFGSQIAARALGGDVRRGEITEIGWYDLDSDEPAIARGPWFQWHGDVVTLPPGAIELARNELCPQAWRSGRTLCTQFHPEVNASIVARWAAGGADEARANGVEPGALVDSTRRHEVESRPHTDRLVDWFVDHVAD
jgi:GMP synthase-like glutamine amidotransferase